MTYILGCVIEKMSRDKFDVCIREYICVFDTER